MNIAICYVYVNGWYEKAVKFMGTYEQFPPGMDHQTVIMCNGFEPTDEYRFFFGAMPGLTMIHHDNTGQDIGAFQKAAQSVPCDVMLFLGAHTYFRRANWLLRVQQTVETYGEALYGATGNQGDSRFNVWPHVRTTAFWCSPGLMNAFPWRITDNAQRYEFEHGASGLTSWTIRDYRKRALICGFQGEVDVYNSDSLPGGFRNGDQNNVLIGDRMTQIPYGCDPT